MKKNEIIRGGLCKDFGFRIPLGKVRVYKKTLGGVERICMASQNSKIVLFAANVLGDRND